MCHWTGGSHTASDHDRQFYHLLLEHVEGDPRDPDDDATRWVEGVPIARNMQELKLLPPYHRDPATGYAAHTRHFNSQSIGLALCGMRGAVDYRPDSPPPRGVVDPGTAPITRGQVVAMVGACVQFLAAYDLPLNSDTVFSHYEAETLHGVDQVPPGPGTWKFDVSWIPGLDLPSKEDYGGWIREQVRRMREGEEVGW